MQVCTIGNNGLDVAKAIKKKISTILVITKDGGELEKKLNALFEETKKNYKDTLDTDKDSEALDIICSELADCFKKNSVRNILVSTGVSEESQNSLMSKDAFLDFFKGGRARVTTPITTQGFDKIEDVQSVRQKDKALFTSISRNYGGAPTVLQAMIRQTNQDLFRLCFVDRKNKTVVTSEEEINTNIQKYQQELLDRIIKYLVNDCNADQSLRGYKLYDDTGVFQGWTHNGIDIRNLISQHLKTDTNSLQASFQDSQKHEMARSRRFLDAYNAKVLLDHFDEYLQTQLTNIFEIDDFGILGGSNKYHLRDTTTNLASSWITQDQVDIGDITSRIARLAIETTPLYRYERKNKGEWSKHDTRDYITFSTFQNIISKIKSLSFNRPLMDLKLQAEDSEFWIPLPEEIQHSTWGKLIAKSMADPMKYMPHLFQMLARPQTWDLEIQGVKVFKSIFDSLIERDCILSIAHGLFTGEDSIQAICGKVGKYDLYSHITQAAATIHPNELMSYISFVNQGYFPESLKRGVANRVSRGINGTINSINHRRLLPDDYFSDTRDVTFTQGGHPDECDITFKVDDTIVSLTGQIQGKSKESIAGSLTTVNVMMDNGVIDNLEVSDLWNLLYKYTGQPYHVDTVLQNALRSGYENENTMKRDIVDFVGEILYRQWLNEQYKSSQRNCPLMNENNAYSFWDGSFNLVGNNHRYFLNKLAKAYMDASGQTISNSVRDSQGNQNPLQISQTLSAIHKNLWELQQKNADSATHHFSIFNCTGGIQSMKEFVKGNETRSVLDMSKGELIYLNLVYDYLGGLASSGDHTIANGTVLFMPTVNSDKPVYSKIPVNLNHLRVYRKGEGSISVMRATPDEIRGLIRSELGQYYANVQRAVNEDLETVRKQICQDVGVQDTTDWQSLAETVRIRDNDVRSTDEILAELIDSAIGRINANNPLRPIELIENLHLKNGVPIKGNTPLQHNIYRFCDRNIIEELGLDANNHDITYGDVKYWNDSNVSLIQHLIDKGAPLDLTRENQRIQSMVQKDGWQDADGRIIWAKWTIPVGTEFHTRDGKTIKTSEEYAVDLVTKDDLTKLGTDLGCVVTIDDLTKGSLKLWEHLERYNTLNYLVSQEFQIVTQGSSISHSYGKSADPYDQESAQSIAQNKRGVVNTAKVIPFQYNTLMGLPEELNVATFEQIEDNKSTINGSSNKINPWDGGTFVHPAMVQLMNNSLGGARGGNTSKPFFFAQNERFGIGELIKTAGFGITNNSMRNNAIHRVMMEQASSLPWVDHRGGPRRWGFDITKGYDGQDIEYGDQFFSRGDRIYQITGITRQEDGRYVRTLQEVNETGQLIGDKFDESSVEINNCWQLYNFFGGMYSMSAVKGHLTYSEKSISDLVTAMNRVGYLIQENFAAVSQSNVWQPLKHGIIHILCDGGAVKMGMGNMNSISKLYTNSPFNYQRKKFYQAGIQLDKEHYVDSSQASLPTQVISACIFKGFSYKEAYDLHNALAMAIRTKSGGLIAEAERFFTFKEGDFAAQVLKCIMNNLSSSRAAGNNFAVSITRDLIDMAAKGEGMEFAPSQLPVSDNTIYAKVLTAVNSFLTSASVRQKMSGVLAVLNPSHEVVKLYGGRKQSEYKDFDGAMQYLYEHTAPVYSTDGEHSLADIDEGVTYDIITTDANGVTTTQTREVTVNEYRKLKQEIRDIESAGGKVTVKENFKAGRNLMGYRVRFNGTHNGETKKYQLLDLNSVQDLDYVTNTRNMDPATFSNLYKKYMHKEYQDSGNTRVRAIETDRLRKAVRQRVQFDLDLLSGRIQLSSQFETMRQNNPTMEHIVHWCNYVLGTGDGDVLRLPDTENMRNVEIRTSGEDNYEITADTQVMGNWMPGTITLSKEQVLDMVREYLINPTTYLEADGEMVLVDSASISKKAYECILPKYFMTRFGLNAGDQLSDINAEYFLNRFKRQMVSIDNSKWDVKLESSNSRHTYLKLKGSDMSSLTKKQNVITDKDIHGNTWIMDQDGNQLYMITDNDEIWTDNNGNDIIYTSNLKFHFNNANYHTVKLTQTDLQDEFKNTLRQAVHDSLKETTNQDGKKAFRFLFKDQLFIKKGVAVDPFEQSKTLDNDLKKAEIGDGSYYSRRAEELNTSFQRSLDIVSARIPAQSMQSFMPMRVVAFDDANLNNMWVSTYQIMLQGSK